MNSEAFVYQWTNKLTNKIYIGKHKGTIDDGYISSGKAFLSAYNNDPELFTRTILYYGTESDCLQRESELIKQAINERGYHNIYNLTTHDYLNQWKRTCTHCGSIVDPRNEEWLANFELQHFENCKEEPSRKAKTVKKKKHYYGKTRVPIWKLKQMHEEYMNS